MKLFLSIKERKGEKDLHFYYNTSKNNFLVLRQIFAFLANILSKCLFFFKFLTQIFAISLGSVFFCMVCLKRNLYPWIFKTTKE